MNELDQAIVDYCQKQNLPCEQSAQGWTINHTEFECAYWDNTKPVWVEGSRRVLYNANIPTQLQKIHDWLFRKPTVKIEQLQIQNNTVDHMIEITGWFCSEPAVRSNFRIDPDRIFWLDTQYITHHVPGWLSKSLKTVLNHTQVKPIECLTNAKNSSYERHLGFRVVNQTDCREYAKEYGVGIPQYEHPETILMWRLRRDNFSTL